VPFKLTQGAVTVLERRYLDRDSSGRLREDPAGMLRRVAANIAAAEALYDPDMVAKCEAGFYRMMSSLEFLPNSPTLMNAGGRLQQLASCFVLPGEDSLASIFQAVKPT